jgi:predicted Rossmann-fold nucleotide-binding protein
MRYLEGTCHSHRVAGSEKHTLRRDIMDKHYQLICGGREFENVEWMSQHLIDVLKRCSEKGIELHVVTGLARGADRLAHDVAQRFGVEVHGFVAQWSVHGRSAGYKRNVRMAEFLVEQRRAGHSVDVVAFPGGRGTEHMRNISRERGITVYQPRDRIECEL